MFLILVLLGFIRFFGGFVYFALNYLECVCFVGFFGFTLSFWCFRRVLVDVRVAFWASSGICWICAFDFF